MNNNFIRADIAKSLTQTALDQLLEDAIYTLCDVMEDITTAAKAGKYECEITRNLTEPERIVLKRSGYNVSHAQMTASPVKLYINWGYE